MTLTSMAVLHMDQDFSFPAVVDSFSVSAEASLWRISSLDSSDFFDRDDNGDSKSAVPSPSPAVHKLEKQASLRSGSTDGGGGYEGVEAAGRHDRTETMDILWEEFNFSEEQMLQKAPSHNLTDGALDMETGEKNHSITPLVDPSNHPPPPQPRRRRRRRMEMLKMVRKLLQLHRLVRQKR
ncbi:hypothetical protein SAY86_010268 [Trapa natans]|uniref:Uncharacterized protein n=1 Tax=Trapa natans TaxID=22666 RepID=A0AAN7KSB2_TRANT|nr:hypothetical protein SAY86_010268 [Trapa natans]